MTDGRGASGDEGEGCGGAVTRLAWRTFILRMRWFTYLIVWPTACLLACVAPIAAADATITIALEHDIGAVNRLAFGHNVEAADPRGVFEDLTSTTWNREPIRTGEGLWNPTTKAVEPAVASRLTAIGITALRYPGGSLAGAWDWHQAVGPVAGRGDWTFGLDEYLTACAQLHASPVITLSDYTGTTQDLADLVEYLNAPADGHHPWADQRAAWGHSAPWGVTWFELGNETSLGTFRMNPNRRMTPAEYVTWASDAATRIKAVDATVKLGVVTVPGTLEDPVGAWNTTVINGTRTWADFVVVHLYAPEIPDGSLANRVAPVCLAAADQLMGRVAAYKHFIHTTAGRDLPIWMTEFNVMAVQATPVPYRFSWAAGLMCADLQRQLLDPASGVAGACYWQAVNGYWGLIDTRTPGSVLEYPTFAAQQLLAQHVGQRLVATTVTSPTEDFANFSGFWACHGTTRQESQDLGVLTGTALDLSGLTTPWASATAVGNGLSVRLSGITSNAYSPVITSFARPGIAVDGCSYQIAFSARFTPDSGSGSGTIGISAIDGRGYGATNSGIAITGVESASTWTDFSGTFFALSDAPGIDISLRCEGPTSAVNGLLELRDLVVTAKTLPTAPAVPIIAATSSRTADQGHVVVINRSVSQSATVTIDGGAQLLAPVATMIGSTQPGSTAAVVTLTDHGPVAAGTGTTWTLTMPPASMAGIDFTIGSGSGSSTTTGSTTTTSGATAGTTTGATTSAPNDTGGGGGGCGAGTGALALLGASIAAFAGRRRSGGDQSSRLNSRARNSR